MIEKSYEEPRMNVVSLPSEDVVRTSGGDKADNDSSFTSRILGNE